MQITRSKFNKRTSKTTLEEGKMSVRWWNGDGPNGLAEASRRINFTVDGHLDREVEKNGYLSVELSLAEVRTLAIYLGLMKPIDGLQP